MGKNANTINTTNEFGTRSVRLWGLALFLLTGGAVGYYSGNWPGAAVTGLAAWGLLLLAWRDLRGKARRKELELHFVELQLFLLRCRILPSDTKILRNTPPAEVESKKKELTELAISKFEENSKELHETRHVLDKYVGTKASQFATQKGRQTVWEGELTRSIVLFSDVRGFTSMTEKLKPQETVRFLNRMFSELEEAITASGGEINKYIGDAIMAYFPFPADNEKAAVKKAVQTAIRMQDKFQQTHMTFKESYSETVNAGLGVGLACGDLIMGNLGSARRMEFTLIGDTVNLASRLCALAEDGQILICKDLALIGGDMFRMETLPPVRIKGKTGTYEPSIVMGERLRPGLM